MNARIGTPTAAQRRWVQRQLGTAAPLGFQPMAGATSSAVYRVTQAGATRAVLRLFDDPAWLQREADLAEHEAAALTHAERRGLAAPRLIGAAGAGEIGVPAVLMSHVAGRVELRPQRPDHWLAALAATLVAIHHAGCDGFGWHYSSWARPPPERAPTWFADAALWRRMQRVWVRGAPPHDAQFLHRDFHPVNVLWCGDTPSGVVDWVNACCGPAALDIAHCRVNLALMYGPRRADEFLHNYRRIAGADRYDPFWDIDEVLGWDLGQPRYYDPWRDFGLRRIGPRELQDRLRRFIAGAVAEYA